MMLNDTLRLPWKVLEESKGLMRSILLSVLEEVNDKECQMLKQLWCSTKGLEALFSYMHNKPCEKWSLQPGGRHSRWKACTRTLCSLPSADCVPLESLCTCVCWPSPRHRRQSVSRRLIFALLQGRYSVSVHNMKGLCLYEIIKMCEINVLRSTQSIGSNLYINIYIYEKYIYLLLLCGLTLFNVLLSFFAALSQECNPKFAAGQDRFLRRTCTFHVASIISFPQYSPESLFCITLKTLSIISTVYIINFHNYLTCHKRWRHFDGHKWTLATFIFLTEHVLGPTCPINFIFSVWIHF